MDLPLIFKDWRQPRYTGPERRKKKRWRPRPLRVLLVLLVIAALGYLGGAVWLMLQETRLVFEAGATLGPGRPPFRHEQIDLPRADGARQFAWVMERAPGLPWVLFLHGNATTLASPVNLSHYTLFHELELNVLAPEYRGYAGLDGTPTEETLLEDARAAYAYLRERRRVPASRVVLYGWSLGGAVATRLATRVDHRALVTEGAPASMLALMQRRYPLFPVRSLLRNRFDAVESAPYVRAPFLVLHAADDEIVPIADGRRLFEAAREPKRFVETRGGHATAIDLDRTRLGGAISEFVVRETRTGLSPPPVRPQTITARSPSSGGRDQPARP